MSHESTPIPPAPSPGAQAPRLRTDLRRGGRIVSLRDGTTGREWLIPSPTPPAEERYGDSYVEGRTIHGWDEMVPTIDAGAYRGEAYPDHGEAWSVPWEAVMEADGSGEAVRCRTSGLRLARRVRAEADGVHLDYRLLNDSERPFPAWWAAHPMMIVSERAVIDVAQRPERLEATVFGRPVPGVATWDQAQEYAAALSPGEHLKVRFPVAAASWAAIHDGERMEMAWAGEEVRSLAILWDHHGFTPHRTLTIEPSTADGDGLDVADRGGCRMLAPGQAAHWSLRLRG